MEEKELIEKIKTLEENACDSNIDELSSKKQELENIRKHKLQGNYIRSRAKWVEEGEKPSKYFCALESRNFTNKIIPRLENTEGRVIYEQSEILGETKTFYEKLYKKTAVNSNVDFNNDSSLFKDIPKLSYSESESIEGEITIEEASTTLYKMKSNKSPGSDGFSAEFFKMFWKYIGIFVVRSINYGYRNSFLSITQRHGVITLLPKGDKPRHYLKNWRPITLLNTVYKIASGCIANRMKKYIDKIINRDQTGFISNRYIGENTRLIYDLMHYAEEENIPGLLLLIDFEKAFDTLSWSFIQKTLEVFNFGPSIRNWISIFNTDITSVINQGGNISDRITIQRGCRQGDPLSPYIFLICAEILAILIRKNKNIKGISVNNIERKISQLADDTSLILDGSEESLAETFKTLENFSEMSGLHINYEKTHVIWLGSKKYSNETLLPNYRLKWGSTRFTLLGIHFDVELDKIPQLNYEPKLVKIKSIIKQWEKRFLTPIGKITVIKTLVLPLLNHILMSIPNPSDHYLKELEKIFFLFVWNNKTHRVKKDVIVKKLEDGGLKMVNLVAFIDSLKMFWIRYLMFSNKNIEHFIPKLDLNKLINCGIEYITIFLKTLKNRFWVDVFKSWVRLQNISNKPDVAADAPLFYNPNIHIGNKPFFNKQMFDSGIRRINDIINEDGSLLCFESFCNTYPDIRINFFRL